jgi:hypothetical protein
MATLKIGRRIVGINPPLLLSFSDAISDGPNSLIVQAVTGNSTILVEFQHPNTGAWQAGTFNTQAGKWQTNLWGVTAGSYGGTGTALKARQSGYQTQYNYSGPPVVVADPPVKTLTSINIVGPGVALEGNAYTYYVLGTYDDATTAPVTQGVVWASNAPGGILTVPADSIIGNDRTVYVSAQVGALSYIKQVHVYDTTSPGGTGTGVIPYANLAPTYSWTTGTWGSPINFFNGDVNAEAIPAYLESMTPNGDVILTFPRGYYLDQIRLYDGGGSYIDNPVDVYFESWTDSGPTLLTQFYGDQYGTWLERPLPGRIEVRQVTLRSYGPRAMWPTEIEFIGEYPLAPLPTYARKKGRSAAMYGTNTYNYNTLGPPSLFAELQKFSGGRYYLPCYEVDYDPLGYRFASSYGPNWDTILGMWKGVGKKALITLNNNNQANRDSYAQALPNDYLEINRNAMWAYGADLMDPETYRWLGELVFQFIARYGSVVHPDSALKLAMTPRFTGDPIQERLSGLDLISVLMVGNELYKTWKTALGRLTPTQGAVMWAVCFDGYNGTMGPGVGGKLADPAVLVGFGGSIAPDAGYENEFLTQCGRIYGVDAQGRPLVTPKVGDYHDYTRDEATGTAQTFEQSASRANLFNYLDVQARLAPDMRAIKSEYGYTAHPEATGYAPAANGWVDNYSYLPAAFGLPADVRRAACTLSDGQNMARNGLVAAYVYEDYDKVPATPGVQWDFLCGYIGTIFQTLVVQLNNKITLDYEAEPWLNPHSDPTLPSANLNTAQGLPDLFSFWSVGGVSTDVTFDLPNGGTLWEFNLAGGSTMIPTNLAPGQHTFTPSELLAVVEKNP